MCDSVCILTYWQRHGYCTLGEALNRLDFSSAIQDLRRFNYVAKVSLLITHFVQGNLCCMAWAVAFASCSLALSYPQLFQLIARSQLTSLSGAAQKNYFNILEKIVRKGKQTWRIDERLIQWTHCTCRIFLGIPQGVRASHDVICYRKIIFFFFLKNSKALRKHRMLF